MLSRKCVAGNADPIIIDHDIRRHLLACAAAGGTDLVVVISATPVIEAGRDLDADWAVTEPCSERSIVQLAGRVRRHRLWSLGTCNIAILERALRAAGDSAMIVNPGIDTPLQCGKSEISPKSGGRSAAELFPIAAWAERLDASGCLLGARCPAGEAEVAMLKVGLLGDEDENVVSMLRAGAAMGPSGRANVKAAHVRSLAAWLEQGAALWNCFFARERPFRRDDSRMVQEEFALTDDGWLSREKPRRGKTLTPRNAPRGLPPGWVTALTRVSDRSQDAYDTDRLLLPLSMFKIEKQASVFEHNAMASGNPFNEREAMELRTTAVSTWTASNGTSPVFGYVPFLGMETESEY